MKWVTTQRNKLLILGKDYRRRINWGASVTILYLIFVTETAPLHPRSSYDLQSSITTFQKDKKNYDNTKPHLVIHVGPPKTGTKTLQNALNEYDKDGILDIDQYYYGSDEGFMSKDCHWKLYGLRKAHIIDFEHCNSKTLCDDNNKNSSESNHKHNNYNISQIELVDKLKAVPCWNETLERLGNHAKNKRNLLVSAEPWSFDSNRIWTERGHSLVDWKTVHWTLHDTWNILLVFGYRRYPEWIFSSWQQLNRYTKSKPALQKWGGQIIPISPLPNKRSDMAQPHTYTPYRYADHLLNEMIHNPEIEYDILNMHLSGGLVSSFTCGVLPGANHTCQHSLGREKEYKNETRLNPSQSVFFDALALEADRFGLINTTKHQRPTVAKEIQHYYRFALNQSQSDPIKYFPLKCPSRQEHEGFLNLSLSLEEEIVPKFAHFAQAEHRESYWRQVEGNKFCFIDAEATLRLPEWKKFFDGME